MSSIAKEAGIPYRTLHRWISRYRRFGLAGLARKPREDRGKRRALPAQLQEGTIRETGQSRLWMCAKACLFLAVLWSVDLAEAVTTEPRPPELPSGPVSSDIGTVAPVGGTGTADGRFEVVWTLHACKEGVEPVNWSLWGQGDDPAAAIRYKYIYNFASDPHIDFEVENYMINLVTKKTIMLPTDQPFFPGARRQSLDAFWSPGDSLPRYCLVQNESRFATENLWLVKIEESGMTAKDIVKSLNHAVHEILEQKMPLTADAYAISYPASDWDEETSRPEFHSKSVDIPFNADLPKCGIDSVRGVVTIRLPDATVLGATSSTARDDPFHDDPALAKADGKLNRLYQKLLGQVARANRAALRAQQEAWIQTRNDDAKVREVPIIGSDEQDEADFKHHRDESLLKSTLRRIDELGAELQHPETILKKPAQ